jgi:hypothetical protein
MNATHFALAAGVLALLAIGIVGAAPGGNSAVSVNATPACVPHVTLSIPTPAIVGRGSIAIVADVTGSSCTVVVTSYAFLGLPQTPGAVTSSTGIVSITPQIVGVYSISVIATTSLGTVGNNGILQVV